MGDEDNRRSTDTKHPIAESSSETDSGDRSIIPGPSLARDRNRPELWSRSYPVSAGPRSLFLRRGENGFGFTLRHFIVYPPESYAILAGDRRLGLRNGSADEPMDTIFVKNVRENSPASVAGLRTGDRIISVNGETIAGIPYARVIQLIHRTGNYLHLLVVPKENDILQLYFGETAHNPETNQRPRLRSPEPGGMSYRDSRQLTRPYGRSETSPIYQNVSELNRERMLSPTRTNAVRRLSEGGNSGQVMRLEYPKMQEQSQSLLHSQLSGDVSSSGSTESFPSSTNLNTLSYLNSMPAGCRLSLDAGIGRGRYSLPGNSSTANGESTDSSSTLKDSHGSDDSLIMSRIRKSLEQKEEFLKRPPYPLPAESEGSTVAKEFYSRPQKLPPPVWPPPQITASSSYTNPLIPPDLSNRYKSKQSFFSTLDKIQENSTVMKSQESELNANSNMASSLPFHLVSIRAKQFESGEPVEDKTDLYRSELARLSSKQMAASVANKKKEYESRASAERKAFAARETRSLDSAHNNAESSPDKQRPDSDPSVTDTSQKTKQVVRQDSYLAACNKPTITKQKDAGCELTGNATNKSKSHALSSCDCMLNNDKQQQSIVAESERPTRPTQLPLLTSDQPVKLKTTELFFSDGKLIKVTRKDDVRKDGSSEVAETKPKIYVEDVDDTDDDKSTRRISYLKATSGDRATFDSEYELSDTEPLPAVGTRSVLGSRRLADAGTALSENEKENQTIIKESSLLCKVTLIDGKKAADRSWKPVWVVLKGPILCIYKEKDFSSHPETPATLDKTDATASCDRIDIRCSVVQVACDYTKRRHVFRLNAPSVGAELLLQADDTTSMTQWIKALQEQAMLVTEPKVESVSNTSPNAANKAIRKLTSLRNRSPTGESPATKTRKPTQIDQLQVSPKSKTWRNRMAKQFKRIQHGHVVGSPASPTAQYPPGATIGIPLELCPVSSFSEFVPLLVEMCTNIVEARGLEIIGIYRVPGNTAAVTSLTEAVNRGLDPAILDQDPRWSDVNVISSLLKSFFRRLPDSLLTTELYAHFIKADRNVDPIYRMTVIRKLVHDLPDHNFETLKYLLFHLKKVVANSAVNKMEARNLAIVFGPTLVRTSDDNMVTMVTDMSHQCRIVESLILYVGWFFGDGSISDLKSIMPELSSADLEPSSSNHNLLLKNIHKVEGIQAQVSAKDIVSNIIGAANRKMQKAAGKHHHHSSSSSSSSRSKMTFSSANANQISSSSEDVLDNGIRSQRARSKSRSRSSKDEKDKKLLREDLSEGSRSTDSSLSTSIPQVSSAECLSDDGGKDTKQIDSGAGWTYAGLSATTQERIRRFEQETKAMLQRAQLRQKRNAASGENVENSSRVNGDFVDVKQTATHSKNISQSKEQQCEKEPKSEGAIIMRKIGSNMQDTEVNKRLKTEKEIIAKALQRSGSLDSVHQKDRPGSRVSDDGDDLLQSLTATFDKKLQSLLTKTEQELIDKKQEISGEKGEPEDCTSSDNTCSFRDPSLHRTLEKEQDQKKDCKEEEKENNSKCKIIVEDCGENGHYSIAERIMKFDDILNDNKSTRRSQDRKENRLFYSNSVRVRRSESFNKCQENGGVKLRRSGSLNKNERLESRITKFESLLLTKNAEAAKLKRSDSLTKNEKTESNLKRRQQEIKSKLSKEKETKSRRRNGVSKSSKSIKRRHTVGGTKDFDKVSWLDSKEKEIAEMNKENRIERRTSSPDLSSTRVADFLMEVVVRPRSFIAADPNFVSRLLNIPLESQV